MNIQITTSFNSKLVRLKGRSAVHPLARAFAFQFQTGAIKSCVRVRSSRRSLWLFQFQTGAIKRECAHGNGNPRMRFNSKLVRLKDRP